MVKKRKTAVETEGEKKQKEKEDAMEKRLSAIEKKMGEKGCGKGCNHCAAQEAN